MYAITVCDRKERFLKLKDKMHNCNIIFKRYRLLNLNDFSYIIYVCLKFFDVYETTFLYIN